MHAQLNEAVGGNLMQAAPSVGTRSWQHVRDEFLALVSGSQRQKVADLLAHPRNGGKGLRMWLQALKVADRPFPSTLPESLIQVYLDDHEAVPLFDCSQCGLAIPVRPSWRDHEGNPARVYFESCPCCDGPTGLYAYWSNSI